MEKWRENGENGARLTPERAMEADARATGPHGRANKENEAPKGWGDALPPMPRHRKFNIVRETGDSPAGTKRFDTQGGGFAMLLRAGARLRWRCRLTVEG